MVNPPIKNFIDRYSADVILFIGAGASVNFGFPLMNNFFSNYFPNFGLNTLKDLEFKPNLKGNDIILLCMYYLYENQIIERSENIKTDLEEVLQLMIDIRENINKPDNPNLLKALNLAIIAKYGENVKNDIENNNFFKTDLWKNFSKEIDKSIEKLTLGLYKIYGKIENENIEIKLKESYFPLFDIISELTRGNIMVFTTNYDPVLDIFLKNNSNKYDRIFVNGFKYDNQIKRNLWKFQNYFLKTDSNVISYFNLHGSVLWEKEGNNWIYHEPSEFKEIDYFENALIKPPIVKISKESIFMNIYDFYTEILKNQKPKFFITIGFSFRDTDILEITKKHIKENENLIFIYFSPHADKNIKIIFGEDLQNKIIPFTKAFGLPDCCKELGQTIKNRINKFKPPYI